MKSNKGITLIALIITIIVMLILVAVTLTIVLGDNGILNKAREATTKQEAEQEREILQDLVLGALNEKTMTIDNDKIVLPEGWSKVNGKYTSPSGNEFTVLANGTISLEIKNGNTPEQEEEELQIIISEATDEGVVDFNVLDEKILAKPGWSGSDGTYTSPSNIVFAVALDGTISMVDNMPIKKLELGKEVPDGVMVLIEDDWYASDESVKMYFALAAEKGHTVPEEEINEFVKESEMPSSIPNNGIAKSITILDLINRFMYEWNLDKVNPEVSVDVVEPPFGEMCEEVLGYPVTKFSCSGEGDMDLEGLKFSNTIKSISFSDCSGLNNVPDIPGDIEYIYFSYTNVTEITYAGTVNDFKDIDGWDRLDNIIVHCTDGDIN